MKELHGTHESAYEYDGASRRWRITEKENGTQTKLETFVWCGSRICQKRNGSTVVRSYFGNGFQESGTTNYFYTRDHLGSVREVVGSDGATVASRLSYDPWGKVTETGSGALSDLTYTGHHFDRSTGLNLAQYRGYDAGLGRWLSRDPSGLRGGPNVYGYVSNDPINIIDPMGLWGDDAPATSRWGDYAVNNLDEPGVQALGAMGVVAYGGLAVETAVGAAVALRNWLFAAPAAGKVVADKAQDAANQCSRLPALMQGPGGKMLGQAVGHLKGTPGAERVGTFRQFAGQITSSTNGQWSAKEFAARNATIFAGEWGRSARVRCGGQHVSRPTGRASCVRVRRGRADRGKLWPSTGASMSSAATSMER